MYYFSKFVDHHLQSLTTYLSAYLKDMNHLIALFTKLSHLPDNTRIFTFDVVAMYTNITTEEGVKQVRIFLDSLEKVKFLPLTFPKQEILEILKIIMDNNVIQFGNTYWLQQRGAVMGILPACIYTRIFFDDPEKKLLTKYSKKLALLKRFINDGI